MHSVCCPTSIRSIRQGLIIANINKSLKFFFSCLMNNHKIYGLYFERKYINTIELRSIHMHLDLTSTHSIDWWILICHYSEIHEQSISLSHYNDPIMHIHGVATLISEIHLRLKRFLLISLICAYNKLFNDDCEIFTACEHISIIDSIFGQSRIHGNAHT